MHSRRSERKFCKPICGHVTVSLTGAQRRVGQGELRGAGEVVGAGSLDSHEKNLFRPSRVRVGCHLVGRRHTDLARPQELATVPRALEGSSRRRLGRSHRGDRNIWRVDDSMAADCPARSYCTGNRVSYFCLALHTRYCCAAAGLRSLGKFLRTILSICRSVDRLCGLRSRRIATRRRIGPARLHLLRNLRHFVCARATVLSFGNSGVGSQMDPARADVLGDNHNDCVCSCSDCVTGRALRASGRAVTYSDGYWFRDTGMAAHALCGSA